MANSSGSAECDQLLRVLSVHGPNEQGMQTATECLLPQEENGEELLNLEVCEEGV